MSSEPHSHIYCKAYQSDDVPDDESSSDVEFNISIHAQFRYISFDGMEDDDQEQFEVKEITRFKVFMVKRDCLLHNRASRLVISQMLTDMHVSSENQPVMIEEISVCARSMASAPPNTNRKTLPMTVTVGVIYFGEVEDDSVDSSESEDEEESKMVCASKSSIKELEKVKIEGFLECAICLEELLIGSEATCLPCSHVFHGNCIVSWLEKSGCCPLCRFRLPS